MTMWGPRSGPWWTGWKVSAPSLHPIASLCRGFGLWVMLWLLINLGSCYINKVITVNAGFHSRKIGYHVEEATGESPCLGCLLVSPLTGQALWSVAQAPLVLIQSWMNWSQRIKMPLPPPSENCYLHGMAKLCELWMTPERNSVFCISKRAFRTF